ncbi:hypothetical protein [Bradyrhizobium lablabi]|uniref:hypothetical protein n=1 Tax=Bradyrhizobium lablabi TaxID=722472 RepID=UPI00090B1FB4|nr:hypothetical protein [Bradyrhizobium lablabi]SHL14969.1 hypothetical protein SAMN05444321_1915 [Bradyrhizobium lablabi]
MTTTETATQKKNVGHRFKVGHKHFPRWRKGAAAQAPIFKRRSAKLLRAIIDERGELSTTQLLFAQNVADLGATILELKDRRNAGEYIDPVAISNLMNAQRRAIAALDE